MNHENGKMSPYIEFEEKKKNIERSILALDTMVLVKKYQKYMCSGKYLLGTVVDRNG